MNDVLQAFHRKPVDTPVIAITGGKGGTGKTTLAVNLAAALSKKGQRILLVDTDVDSPTTAITSGLKPRPIKKVKIFTPKINPSKCNKCGQCSDACHAHAIIQIKDKYPMFFRELCSGCEACVLACHNEAIENSSRIIGHIYYASNGNISFIGGELRPNETRSTQVVAATKEITFKKACKEKFDTIIVDTPPGTHCNVLQSLRGVDMALAVTEPTPLGTYDLDLILRLTAILKIRTKIIINKTDIPGGDRNKIFDVAKSYATEVISEIPIDRRLFQSYIDGKPFVTEHPYSTISNTLTRLAEKIVCELNDNCKI
jgi:MinD superfamily P-loop ATPase